MKKIRVLIRPREGLLDPQGRAVEELLRDRGFRVKGMRVGKLLEFEVEEGTDVRGMVEKYVVNPLIEEFEIEES